jgi:hypothetical protein
MKIELKIIKGRAVGYDMIPETSEDKEILGTVRDMIFFGIDETSIKYDGIELIGDGKKAVENLSKLKFIQKKHQK